MAPELWRQWGGGRVPLINNHVWSVLRQASDPSSLAALSIPGRKHLCVYALSIPGRIHLCAKVLLLLPMLLLLLAEPVFSVSVEALKVWGGVTHLSSEV